MKGAGGEAFSIPPRAQQPASEATTVVTTSAANGPGAPAHDANSGGHSPLAQPLPGSLDPSQPTETSLLVSSCDAYSDLWEPFFTLFWRYWPDCPFPVFLESNFKDFDHPRVTTLKLGADTRWGAMTRRALGLVPGEQVLLFLDDYLLVGPVSTASVRECTRLFRQLDGNYMRLRPNPPPDRAIPGLTLVGEISRQQEYRTSLEVALWKKSTLMELARVEYSPWDMEDQGTRCSRQYDGFYSVTRETIPRHNGVERGVWLRYNLPILRQAGIVLDGSRPVMSRREHVRLVLKSRVRLPYRVRLRLWQTAHLAKARAKRLLASGGTRRDP
jgi:hypothetical protein